MQFQTTWTRVEHGLDPSMDWTEWDDCDPVFN